MPTRPSVHSRHHQLKSISRVASIAALSLSIITAAAISGCSGISKEGSRTLLSYVNPFIGASTNTDVAGVYHGLGKTFPGAATPFGMVQVSPNTVTGGDNGSGYSYEMKTIEGFAMTQMSGVGWYGDLGNFLVMPTTGPLRKIAGKEDGSIEGWRSGYDKSTETASPGYYSVNLTDYGIKVECSATPRCGILRFTWPESDISRIQVDLARRVGGTSEEQYVKIVDDHTIEGWMRCTPETGGWGDGAGKALYTVYFHAELDRPWGSTGFWCADIPDDWTRKRRDVTSRQYLERVEQAPVFTDLTEIGGKHVGFYTEFPTGRAEETVLKVGISFVDVDGARNNFKQEIEAKDFETVRSEAERAWNDQFSKIIVSGGSEADKTVFYTALYHTMIDPRLFTDCDGRYVGGDYAVHESGTSFSKRTIFSGWDVFRSQMPLQTIINPQVVGDIVASLVTMADQSGKGYLERWEFLNAYSGCMVGNPAIAVMADAYAKGIRCFDAGEALKLALSTSEKYGNHPLGWTPSSISETLEYAYSDWCVARLAEALGDQEITVEYDMRSKAYRNIFDPGAGWFRPRSADGTWKEWPDEGRLKDDYGCVESNPYQQGWFVPHDIEGMVELMGGREKVLADLDSFFNNTPDNLMWNSYYNHANEPVHFIPFLFNELGQPWKTQKWTRFICSHAYSDDPMTGLVGNDDVGQMSAWYVLAAAGLHPICPGDTRMEITSPVFDKVEIRTDKEYASGKTFTVIAVGNSPENIYIQEARLNGKLLAEPYMDFKDIAAGGTLKLTMGPEPAF